MDTVIIAAIIGVIGTIVGSVLTVFGRDLLDKSTRGKDSFLDILGLWNCEWYITNSAGDEQLYMSDTIKITKLNGRKIEARGHDAIGEYVLYGDISPANVVTLLYEAKDKRISLTGAVVMKVSPLADRMEGKWYGYTREDVFQGGKVLWKRSTS